MKNTTGSKTAGMSDSAVKNATGKTWAQWLTTLDRAGARKLAHREIALYLHRTHRLSGWWSQMVTVGYEQMRGLREKHEKPDGFEISRSKTVNASDKRAFAAWKDARTRKQWLDAQPLRIRTATPNRSMRLTWVDGEQVLSVQFYRKDTKKTQVVVQHGKLPNARAAERSKHFWGEALEAFKSHLEG